jgi:hypothetical protein
MTGKSDAENLEDIRTKPTVPVWPHYGFAFCCSRNKAYEQARLGGPEFLRMGRMIRVITAPLRKQLGLDSAQVRS